VKTKRDCSKLYILLISGLFLFLIPTISLGATFCVDSTTDLQTTLTTAMSNGEDDTVRIVQGTYSGNFVYASTEGYGVTIEGGYTPGCTSRVVDPANTVLDGNATGNVLVLSCPDNAVEFSVYGVTLQNGSVAGNGGGLYANTANGDITLTNNTIKGNSGRGVDATGFSTVTLTKNTIKQNLNSGFLSYTPASHISQTFIFTKNTIMDNSCDIGGAGVSIGVEGELIATFTENEISQNTVLGAEGAGGVMINGYTSDGIRATFTKNIITDNSVDAGAASWGGGVGIYGSTDHTDSLIFYSNLIVRNSAGDGSGGGISIFGHSDNVTLDSNTIKENNAGQSGGGVAISGYKVILTNNNISNNSAIGYGRGGGVFASGSTVTLTNNTIAKNSANTDGGGVYLILYDNSNTAHIYNNIIYNNTAISDGNDLYINNDGYYDFLPSPVNLYNNDFDQSTPGTYIEIPFAIDPSNLNNPDPLFTNPANGDYHLNVSSPCINAGKNDAPDFPSTDQDGNPRISDGIVDMGAYEFTVINVTPPAAPKLTVATTGLSVTISWDVVSSATGYTLFYAPHPYTGPETIRSVDMVIQTSISVNLWQGAAFYVAVQARNSAGSSGYSNIGFFSIQ
jgi:hypothetical protein